MFDKKSPKIINLIAFIIAFSTKKQFNNYKENIMGYVS